MRRVKEVSGQPLSRVRELSTLSLDKATYYQTASARISSEDLRDIQSAVRALAEGHGYPTPKPRGASLEFDQQLATLLIDRLPILPSDAADEGVWSFLTLNVCPEVALWRYPNAVADDGTFSEKYERLLGKPRNVFRRSWWRGYILGAELSSLLLEDESVGIMERPSIGGNPRLARTVAETHLKYVSVKAVRSRQDLLRESIKRLRRRMGQISVHSLSDVDLARIVDDEFKATVSALSDRSRSAIKAQVDAIQALATELPTLWDHLSPYAIEVPWNEMADLGDRLPSYRLANEESEMARKLSNDLEALIMGWESYSPHERAVVHATVAYFLLVDDAVPDFEPNGFDDDDAVVAAAYKVLNLIRD